MIIASFSPEARLPDAFRAFFHIFLFTFYILFAVGFCCDQSQLLDFSLQIYIYIYCFFKKPEAPSREPNSIFGPIFKVEDGAADFNL